VEKDPIKARQEYLKAVIMYFLANWVSFKETQISENYHDLLAAADKIDSLASPATEKVYFPWKKGHLAGRFRSPDSAEKKRYPAIVIVQGNDTVKECFILLEAGKWFFCPEQFDQAGWGESRLSGNRFEALTDAKLLAELALNYFTENPCVDEVLGGDHMCTETLLDVQIPQILDWLDNQLKNTK